MPARLAAAAVVADVVAGQHAIDGEVAHPKYAGLDERDRALARSIATVSLRRLGTLRKALAQFLDRGMPKKSGALEWILLITAAQTLFLDVPDHAAVDLCVHAVRLDPMMAAFAGLANAVSRSIIRHREAILAASDPLIDDTPAWLVARWTREYGEAGARAIAQANRTEPTLDLTVKQDPAGWAARLGGIVLPTGSVRLLTETPIVALEGYAEGEWWVQDAAAALPARLLNARAGERIGDFCAAPGGKTAQLLATGAAVTALDRSAERLKRLTANLDRLGLSAEIAIGDVLAYKAAPFDGILLDAPCTATGTIRRHPDVAWTKRASDVMGLATTQAAMLDKAASLLKPGGRLVYCTCSLEPEEGATQIAALMRRNPDFIREPIEAAEIGGLAECVTPLGDLRTIPSQLPGDTPRVSGLDGFYAARLVRRS